MKQFILFEWSFQPTSPTKSATEPSFKSLVADSTTSSCPGAISSTSILQFPEGFQGKSMQSFCCHTWGITFRDRHDPANLRLQLKWHEVLERATNELSWFVNLGQNTLYTTAENHEALALASLISLKWGFEFPLVLSHPDVLFISRLLSEWMRSPLAKLIFKAPTRNRCGSYFRNKAG